jgi:N-acetylmuramate 1-kinase
MVLYMNSPINTSSPGEEFTSFIRFFLEERDVAPAVFDLDAVPADGSVRRFWRVLPEGSEKTFIAVMNEPVDGPATKENFAYLMIGRHLHGRGLPLPEIHASDMDRGWFIVEDFGNVNLQDVASSNKDRMLFYEKVAEVLLRLQVEGARGFNPSWTCQTEKYDRAVMGPYESGYFKEAFLHGYLGMKKEWPELESPLNHLAERASIAEPRFFLHRDFQSRNIMVLKDGIGVLDWQGGRLGPLGYDLASLLIDPYAALSKEEKALIYRRYKELLSERLPEEVEVFEKSYPYLALQRNLQILGAFSFLSRVRRKTHFERYIEPAVGNLCELLVELGDERLSPLREVVEEGWEAIKLKAESSKLKGQQSWEAGRRIGEKKGD